MKVIGLMVLVSASIGLADTLTRGFSVRNETDYTITLDVSFQYGASNRQNRTVSLARHTEMTITPVNTQEKPDIITIHTLYVHVSDGQRQTLSVEQRFPYREILVGACRARMTVVKKDLDRVSYQMFFACE